MNEAQADSQRYPATPVDAHQARGVQIGHGNVQHNHFHHPTPVDWPQQVGIAPMRAGSFQDRDITAVLDQAVKDVQTAVVSQVLSGLGGVGKTQLAAEYARQALATGLLELVVWVAASSRDSIVSSYAAASDAVAGGQGRDNISKAKQFLAWLTTTGRRWLVVLDDLSDLDNIAGLWPPPALTGRTIVTTRRRDAALSRGRHLINVGIYTPPEAHAYLMTALDSRPKLADDVAGLATDLGFLPLALSHAAAYMIDRDLTCVGYRRRFADRKRRLAELLPEYDALPDDYQQTITLTWSVSIDTANQLRPTGLAKPLLELASMLDPSGIPEALFTTTAARNWLAHATSDPDTGWRDIDDDTARDGLRCLQRFNLATVDNGLVRVHSLVQRATREALSHDRAEETAWAAADALEELWPEVERDTAFAQTLRANTHALRQCSADALLAPDGHPVLFRAGRSLGEAGDPTGAAAATNKLLHDFLRVSGPDHLDTLVTRNNLANWLAEAGDPGGAAAAAEELLNDFLRVYGPDHPDTLTTCGNLARWRGEAGDPLGAVITYEELLADFTRVFGPDNLHTLTTRNNLALWRATAGDLGGAVAAHQQLLNDVLGVFGPDHPLALTARQNIAYCRAEAGDLREAAAGTEDLLTDRLRVLGPDHPETLATRSTLAAIRGDAGDPAGAAITCQELLADFLRVLGPDHPQTLTARRNIAKWRGEAGDADVAATMLEDLLRDRLRVLGPDHPDTLSTRDELAEWRGDAGDLPGAIAVTEELLAEHLRLFGPEHPETLSTRHDLARWHAEAGDLAGAIATTEALLADSTRVLGPDHFDTLATRHNLAVLRGAAGDLAGAIATAEELLADHRRLFGPDHPATLDALATLDTLVIWRSNAGQPASHLPPLRIL
jgi:hypothetical protein